MNEYIAILGDNSFYEFTAEDVQAAINLLSRRFSDMGWRLYEIDPITGKVPTEPIMIATAEDKDGISRIDWREPSLAKMLDELGI